MRATVSLGMWLLPHSEPSVPEPQPRRVLGEVNVFQEIVDKLHRFINVCLGDRPHDAHRVLVCMIVMMLGIIHCYEFIPFQFGFV